MKTSPMIHRFGLLAALLLIAAVWLGGGSAAAADSKSVPSTGRIPVILDTDIGDDIDDTWALGFLLKSPELDLKLVVGDYGRASYRARLLAKLLERARRTDVPVGVGLEIRSDGEGRQEAWVKDYDLKSYPGKVHPDGVQALIDTIMKSDRPITLICIGPLPNIAAALEREPRIAQRARFVGMHGSVRIGYGAGSPPAAEWNVKADPKACARAFTAAWPMTITPLDTCGLLQLKGAKYLKVRDSRDPIAQAIVENYRIWATDPKNPSQPNAAESHSSILFDTVAIYLAFRQDLCTMETLNLRVTDDGFTRIDPAGKAIQAATAWKDLAAFEDLLVSRIVDGR